MPGSFFDTDILAYLASGDTAKADRAEHVLAAGGAISVQVRNELANLARRKMRLSLADTRSFLGTLRALLTVHPLTIETHDIGMALADRDGLPLYDSMIAAAALHAGCDTLWSEDMQHGMTLEGRLRILNPFAHPQGGSLFATPHGGQASFP